MEVLFFPAINVHQCNIAFGVVLVQVFITFFLSFWPAMIGANLVYGLVAGSPVRARGCGGAGGGGLQPPPHLFRNFKELLRKRIFQPPHFEPLVSPPPPPPPTFKVAPRALPVGFKSKRFVSEILLAREN